MSESYVSKEDLDELDNIVDYETYFTGTNNQEILRSCVAMFIALSFAFSLVGLIIWESLFK